MANATRDAFGLKDMLHSDTHYKDRGHIAVKNGKYFLNVERAKEVHVNNTGILSGLEGDIHSKLNCTASLICSMLGNSHLLEGENPSEEALLLCDSLP